MSEQRIGSSGASSAGEVMSVLQFEDELRRLARFHVLKPVENPLADAVKVIIANPAFTQSRLLGRLLTGLAYQRGQFRRAEASAFDSTTLGLAVALMNAALAGTTGREWVDAISAADAAVGC